MHSDSNITILPGTLNEDQQRFMAMVTPYQWANSLFSWPSWKLDTASAEKFLRVAASGEQLMLRFIISVWEGSTHDFDFIAAAAELDAQEKRVIAAWFLDPFWP